MVSGILYIETRPSTSRRNPSLTMDPNAWWYLLFHAHSCENRGVSDVSSAWRTSPSLTTHDQTLRGTSIFGVKSRVVKMLVPGLVVNLEHLLMTVTSLQLPEVLYLQWRAGGYFRSDFVREGTNTRASRGVCACQATQTQGAQATQPCC